MWNKQDGHPFEQTLGTFGGYTLHRSALGLDIDVHVPSKEYVCVEHVEAIDDDVFEDENGRTRKRFHVPRPLKIACFQAEGHVSGLKFEVSGI